MTARKRYWLMKSEPDAFSIDDLAKAVSYTHLTLPTNREV